MTKIPITRDIDYQRPNQRLRKRGKFRGRMVNSQAYREICELFVNASMQRDLLIEHLHVIQDHYGYIHSDHIVALAELMHLATVEVYEVATFYHHFRVIKDGEEKPKTITVRVCDSISCAQNGAESLFRKLTRNMGNQVNLERVPCVGRCAQAPVVVVGQNAIAPADMQSVQSAVEKGETKQSLPPAMTYEEYTAKGGYLLYQQFRAGGLSTEEVIQTLEESGLRGLGGAGFPLGRKWRIINSQTKPRLLAVNIDEGEPGTFKDREFLEQDPHRMLEGMLIAAHACEIKDCYLYVRDEYPAILSLLHIAVEELQNNIDYDLPEIHLRRGAGAYICGEESAMIESIEGRRGMPRLRPPYVAEVGLFAKPTLEHNAESLFRVREILELGAQAFASQGRHNRKGLRAFSVSGRVQKPGVHVAPAGITLRELIAEYCGGMQPGHKLYGYFPGGASGGILPASLADIPLDFDTLQPYGCFIGSAAIIVLSNQDQAREVATNAMRFFAHESCGQCTPCRVGTKKASQLMEDPQWDKETLEDLCQVMEDASICGLGQAAANPIRSIFKYFPKEVS